MFNVDITVEIADRRALASDIDQISATAAATRSASDIGLASIPAIPEVTRLNSNRSSTS